MTKAIIVVGNTKHEAEQWIAKAGMPQPCIALDKTLHGIKGMRVAQVLILSTVKDLPVRDIGQLRRQLSISIGGALTLENAMRRGADTIRFIKEPHMSNVNVKTNEFDEDKYEDATYFIDPARECLTVKRDGKEVAHYPRGHFMRVHLTDK